MLQVTSLSEQGAQFRNLTGLSSGVVIAVDTVDSHSSVRPMPNGIQVANGPEFAGQVLDNRSRRGYALGSALAVCLYPPVTIWSSALPVCSRSHCCSDRSAAVIR